MTQIAQIVDLVQDLQTSAARHRTTFVVIGAVVRHVCAGQVPLGYAGSARGRHRYRY